MPDAAADGSGDAAFLDAPLYAPCEGFADVFGVSVQSTVLPKSDFSVDASDLHAVLIAQKSGGAAAPHLLSRINTTVPWDYDMFRDTLPAMTSPRIASYDLVYASTGAAPLAVYPFAYTTAWTQGAVFASDTTSSSYPKFGGKVAGSDVVAWTVEASPFNRVLHVSQGGVERTWLDAINAAGNPTGITFTADGLTAIYSLAPAGLATGARLYWTKRASPTDPFPTGKSLTLPGFGEDIEPSLAGDCSHLYFRRDATILVAR
jgi:hypothetical protein